MPRGRLVEAARAEAYEPPETSASLLDSSPEARIDEAVRAGFAQGLQRGRAEAAAALDAERNAQRQKAAAALAEIHALRGQVLAALRSETLDLAVEIAGRIVRERIESGDPVAARIALETLADAPTSALRRVRVSPDDHDALLSAVPSLGGPGTVEIVPDPSVPQGGVVVESGEETVDARIDVSLAAARDALDEER